MKKRLWCALPIMIFLILCVIAAVLIKTDLYWYFCKPSPTFREFKLVDNAGYAWWSADGKALFYTKMVWTLFSGSHTRFYRYDVTTGRRRSYRMPDAGHVSAVSPDEKWAALEMGDAIWTASLDGGNRRKIYTSTVNNEVPKHIYWLASGRILFVMDGIYIINPNGLGLSKLVTGEKMDGYWMMEDLLPASDGSSFLYPCSDGYYHLYDLTKMEDKPIPALGRISDYRGVTFIYLSRRLVIYFEYNDQNYVKVWQAGNVKALNLRTLRTKSFHLPIIPNENIVIAPDLSKYWFASVPKGEWSPAELHVVDIPTKVVRELRKP